MTSPFFVFVSMHRSLTLFCLFALLFASTHARQFSQETRNADVNFLERATLPFRRTLRLPWHPVQSLVDFMASRTGLIFLVANFETLWYQELLEIQYERPTMCENVQSEETRRGSLSPSELRFKTCLCSPYLPFLHCLALGSQVRDP